MMCKSKPGDSEEVSADPLMKALERIKELEAEVEKLTNEFLK